MQSTGNAVDRYQRLEFLGDRVLGLIVSEYLYHNFPDSDEGQLTDKMRFVSNDNLDVLLESLDRNFLETIARFKKNYRPDLPQLTANDLEAFIGDYYESHGFAETQKMFDDIFRKEIDRFDPTTDFISRLQIFTQQYKIPMPEYSLITDETLPNNEHKFHMRVTIGEKEFGNGQGKRKSIAKQQAAEMALENLNPDNLG